MTMLYSFACERTDRGDVGPCGWRGLATLNFAQVHYQDGVDRLEQYGVPPRVKNAGVSSRPREAFVQHPPLIAAR